MSLLIHLFCVLLVFLSLFLFFCCVRWDVTTETHSYVNTAHCRVIKLESSPAPFPLVTCRWTVPPCCIIHHKPVDFHLCTHIMLSALHRSVTQFCQCVWHYVHANVLNTSKKALQTELLENKHPCEDFFKWKPNLVLSDKLCKVYGFLCS